MLLIGLAPRPIGVDIERVGPAIDPPWNVLAPDEIGALVAIEDPVARHDAFMRLWTVKEAALKALGIGLVREPSALAVTFEAGGARLRQESGTLATSSVCVDSFGWGSARFIWACVVL